MYLVAIAVIGGGGFLWRVDHMFRHPDPPGMSVTDSVDGMCPVFVPPAKLDGFARTVGYPPDNDYALPTPAENAKWPSL